MLGKIASYLVISRYPSDTLQRQKIKRGKNTKWNRSELKKEKKGNTHSRIVYPREGNNWESGKNNNFFKR